MYQPDHFRVEDLEISNKAGTAVDPRYIKARSVLDDVDPLTGNRADFGLPSAFYPNTVTILEVGDEFFNHAVYTPALGQPGSFLTTLPPTVT